jgi:hypothetical protein
MKYKRNVYKKFEEDNDNPSHDGGGNEQCCTVDTDISEVLAYASNIGPNNGKPDNFLS